MSGSASGQPANTANTGCPPGPKRIVAVGKVTSVASFGPYSTTDIGGGMAAMLVKALHDSGCYIVVERANIGQVLSEHELKASGAANKETGPALGNLSSVNMLIYGAVTEFGSDDKGGGMSLGLSGGTLGSLLSTAVSRQTASGSVAMDTRLVDASTGEIIKTYTVREPIESSGWDVSIGYNEVSVGGNQFEKTPLGAAARKMVVNTVGQMNQVTGGQAWSGLVVAIDGQDLYINAGTNFGLKNGDKFMIERIVKKLTDPVTGEILGIRKQELGVLQLTGVEDKMSYGTFVPLGTEQPKRGDRVIMVK
jgi:curli biogenesis system outer membrane secretion channel CsgG